MNKNIQVSDKGVLVFKGKEFRCVIGLNGLNENLVEGDKTTPIGCFPIRRVFYRADKVKKPVSPFPTQAIQEDDGWSDDATDPKYNTLVKIPYPFSHEHMWRSEDNLYDIVLELGQNDDPVVPNKGSAIFMHVARSEFTPTHGCVALSEGDLRKVLKACDLDTQVCVSR